MQLHAALRRAEEAEEQLGAAEVVAPAAREALPVAREAAEAAVEVTAREEASINVDEAGATEVQQEQLGELAGDIAEIAGDDAEATGELDEMTRRAEQAPRLPTYLLLARYPPLGSSAPTLSLPLAPHPTPSRPSPSPSRPLALSPTPSPLTIQAERRLCEMEGEMERQLAAADAANAAAFAAALTTATANANATALAAHPSSETTYDAWLGTEDLPSRAEDAAPRAEAAARYARAAGRGDARYSVVGAPRDGAAARIGGVSVGGGYADASDGGGRSSSLERLSAPVRRPQSAGARPSAERTERADVAVVRMPLTLQPYMPAAAAASCV